MKKHIYLIDTSAILSGMPLVFPHAEMMTTPGVAEEFTPGGRDYQRFQLLIETGLQIQSATQTSIEQIRNLAIEHGEEKRLSSTDIELLALAIELITHNKYTLTILTDDYSIQNIAAILNIPYSPIIQRGITKKFKWVTRCPGCGKSYQKPIETCLVCGTKTTFSSHKKQSVKKP
ncbi:MAG: nucleic acid-binding protein [Candidatus Thermoplasmatota archaeon]|nr:nucleic acid-binding protein [Candidatus Thermoplasmatota archaeon]MBU1941400.1 nucleic acid-binding protein [Candidatus Thermoplasmatota archaeon]